MSDTRADSHPPTRTRTQSGRVLWCGEGQKFKESRSSRNEGGEMWFLTSEL